MPSKECRISQDLEESALALEVVLQAAQGRLGLARLLRALRRPRLVRGDAHLLEPQAHGPLDVARRLELGHGEKAARAARVPSHEDEVVFLRTFRAPAQPVLGVQRLAVLVDSEEREVQFVAREGEVVGVAAEGCDGLLGRAHQAHVIEGAVAVQPVLAALVELDRFGLEPGFLRGPLLEPRERRPALHVARLDRRFRVHRGVHRVGHVLHRPQHLELEVGALHLLGARAREEPVAHVVVLRRGHLEELPAGHVVVRQHEPVRRDERSRASAEVHARALYVLEPFGRRREPVLLLELSERQVVEGPHAFVGEGG